jgi:hypothetical protein
MKKVERWAEKRGNGRRQMGKGLNEGRERETESEAETGRKIVGTCARNKRSK